MKRLKAGIVLLMVLALISPVAFAEDASRISTDSEAKTSTAKDWDFSLAPLYLWAVSINGDQTVNGIKVDLDVPFSEIFDNLNGALTFHFEGIHKQRWGFLADLSYIVLNPEDSTPIGDIDINFTQIISELAGIYRFSSGRHTFDGLFGLRYSSMDVEPDLPGPLPKSDKRKDWVDPYIGMRWSWKMAEKWAVRLRGDIGGFGVGSDITWNLVGLVNFKPWKHVSFFGGYRALYQDYEDGSGNNKFKFDATMYGPILGLNITW